DMRGLNGSVGTLGSMGTVGETGCVDVTSSVDSIPSARCYRCSVREAMDSMHGPALSKGPGGSTVMKAAIHLAAYTASPPSHSEPTCMSQHRLINPTFPVSLGVFGCRPLTDVRSVSTNHPYLWTGRLGDSYVDGRTKRHASLDLLPTALVPHPISGAGDYAFIILDVLTYINGNLFSVGGLRV
ncbi:hypothetical protein KIPB_011942, partial [Kipferlia bialata]